MTSELPTEWRMGNTLASAAIMSAVKDVAKAVNTVTRPVFINEPCSSIHFGNERPKNNAKPNMHMFRDELRSTYCRFDTPTAAIMPTGRRIKTTHISNAVTVKICIHIEKKTNSLYF